MPVPADKTVGLPGHVDHHNDLAEAVNGKADTTAVAAVAAAIAASEATATATYPAKAGAETISGAWDFTTAPTLNGGAFGGGGGSTVSLANRGTWATATAYVVGDVVTSSGIRYIAKTAHTSAALFLTDLGAARWTALSLSNAVVTLGVKRDFAAVGDARKVTDAVVTASSTTLTSASAAFTQADVGKTVALPYAGAGATVGETHMTTIASVESATSCTLASAPTKSIAGPRTVTDAAMTANAFNLTSATGGFTATDIGKKVPIPNGWYTVADSGGAPYTVKITGITSATVATISHRPVASATAQTVTLPGATVIIGTDDTAAMQAAVVAASAQRKVLEIEPGGYLITGALVPASNTSVFGHGAGISTIYPCGPTLFGCFQYLGTASTRISDVTIRAIEVDGSGNRASAYTSAGKAIYLRPVLRLRVESCYLHDTASTALGCDWIPDSVFAFNVVDWGGSQVFDFAGGAGGSGIGLGTGLYPQEAVTIIGNTVSNCGNNGIFTEAQSSNVRSRGVRIIGNHVIGCNYGISDRACEGTVIEGNTVVYNETGIYVHQGFVTSLYGFDMVVANNVVKDCATGIHVNTKDGDFTVRGNVVTGRGSSGTAGIYVVPVVGGTLVMANIEGNKVRNQLGRGIWVAAGAWNRVKITDNVVRDCGASTSTRRSAIVWGGTSVGTLYVKDNVCFDTRGASKQQSYGFEAAAGTISRLVLDNNDFTDNQDGETLMTVTPTTTITHFNP